MPDSAKECLDRFWEKVKDSLLVFMGDLAEYLEDAPYGLQVASPKEKSKYEGAVLERGWISLIPIGRRPSPLLYAGIRVFREELLIDIDVYGFIGMVTIPLGKSPLGRCGDEERYGVTVEAVREYMEKWNRLPEIGHALQCMKSPKTWRPKKK